MPPSHEPIAVRPAKMQFHVGIVVDNLDWHARQLSRAFSALGVTTSPIFLQACRITTSNQSGLWLDCFGDNLPDAILVRSMSGGSFQAVTLRLGILHATRELDVMVWNDARAIERCVDKSMTSFLLARAGISTPETWALESREAAIEIVRREVVAGALVLKPLFGSQGRGLKLIRTPDDLPEPIAVNGVYYLQRFCGVERDGYHDFRLLVSNRRVIAAMARHSASWITNIKCGARPVAVVANDEMCGLALRAAAAVGANLAGIDILYDLDGRPTVLEVNSMPAWSGLQSVTSVNIAAKIAGDLVSAMIARMPQGVRA